MSSFFNLQLDTTPPIIEEANIPSYVGYGENLIEIYADEELDNLHEVMIVDSIGYKKNLTFMVEGNRIYGSLDVTSIEPGMATLYIRLYDEVWNKSSLFSQSFEVLDTRQNKIQMGVLDRDIEMMFDEITIKFDFKDMDIERSFEDGEIDMKVEGRDIYMDIENK